jgi:hypothetical protein
MPVYKNEEDAQVPATMGRLGAVKVAVWQLIAGLTI